MRESFKQYLIGEGYSEVTPSGNPSTVYSYIISVERICDRESMSWEELAQSIHRIAAKYELGGSEEDYGSKSHGTPRAAIKKYQDFLANASK